MELHTFHIPVMGIAFTIDTPLKVSHYGINSVISIVEDSLLEKVRKVYSEIHNFPFEPIRNTDDDPRANRIMKYLNLVKHIADEQFLKLKKSCSIEDAIKYFSLLPNDSKLRKNFFSLKNTRGKLNEAIDFAKSHLKMGSIDVNIMTKLDRVNYKNGRPLPREYNDAHAALRGYAKSDLQSSLVLSAGLHPGLYGYMENFDDFYPDDQGFFKKKIIIKVSDYRSALVQGKLLAKRGLWVSEFRVESGLNCGGHAFATDGLLMGPILEEFRQNRSVLQQEMFTLFNEALALKKRPVPGEIPEMKVTAQGGVGTSNEHTFLTKHYGLDTVGWGSPFLLVPEVTCVDSQTRIRVKEAKESDLYLSKISPLGVPFHNLKNNTKDQEKEKRFASGKPGSPCINKYLTFNTEYTEKPICTASRKYQHLKLADLQKQDLPEDEYQKKSKEVIEKACICTGLGASFLLEHNLDTRRQGEGVSICPGPNIAYFNKISTLKEMVDHIYGRIDLISHKARPHMFMKELGLYLNQLSDLVDNFFSTNTSKAHKQIQVFSANLHKGIHYYHDLLGTVMKLSEEESKAFSEFLELARNKINRLTGLLPELG